MIQHIQHTTTRRLLAQNMMPSVQIYHPPKLASGEPSTIWTLSKKNGQQWQNITDEERYVPSIPIPGFGGDQYLAILLAQGFY
jgi:hypothetical protein